MTVYISILYKWFMDEIWAIPGRVIALIFVLLLLALPLISAEPYVMRIVILASIYSIFTASWDLLAGFTGQVSLGHALFFAAGGYMTAALNLAGLPPILTIPGGAVFAGLVGALIAFPVRRLRGFYLSLVTLTFPIIVVGLILAFPDITGGEVGLYGLGRLSSSRLNDYYIVVIIMLACVFAMYKFTDTDSKFIRVGVILFAIREDEISARMSGINTIKYKMISYAICGLFAGIAGGLYAHFIRVVGVSILDLFFSFQVILWAVFGGLATIYGAVVGVFLLYPLVEVLRLYPQIGEFRMVAFALILIITLLFMPEGLSTWVRDRIEVECPRCKLINMKRRRSCRACDAALHLEREN